MCFPLHASRLCSIAISVRIANKHYVFIAYIIPKHVYAIAISILYMDDTVYAKKRSARDIVSCSVPIRIILIISMLLIVQFKPMPSIMHTWP